MGGVDEGGGCEWEEGEEEEGEAHGGWVGREVWSVDANEV